MIYLQSKLFSLDSHVAKANVVFKYVIKDEHCSVCMVSIKNPEWHKQPLDIRTIKHIYKMITAKIDTIRAEMKI